MDEKHYYSVEKHYDISFKTYICHSMQATKTIDIIIPSFRLDEDYLIALVYLPKPKDWVFNYYIIVDNPSIKVPTSIQKLSDEGLINLFINPENLGASASRNKGIDAGTGEWILFLDDDIVADEDLLKVYTEAIQNNPDEIGFIGLTDFLPAINEFTQALQLDHLTHFKIAETRDRFTWGVTANMMYRRSSMHELRFSHIFPKSGGGEDVDLPFRICLRNNKEFKCIKEARVVHPWWNNGKPHYDRFIRYGTGTAYLLFAHKKSSSYDFPNVIESLFILIISAPLFIFFWGWSNWAIVLIAIPFFEYLLAYLKTLSKGINSFKTAYYIALLNNSYHLGIFKTILKNKRMDLFMKRMNPEFSRLHHFHLNKWKIIKIALFLILFICLSII